MAQQIILRKGTAAAWTSANPTLAAGEPGVETDTGKFKLGNGVTAWVSLAYAVGTIPTDVGQLADVGNLIPTNLADLADVVSTAPSSGQVLKWNGTAWAPAADATSGGGTGATYTVSAETTTGGANLRLTGSDASTDDVKFASGAGISVSRTDADTITVASTVTDTNTTYAISAGTQAGGANVVLTAGGSGTGAQNLFLKAGTGITVSNTTSSIIQIDATGGSVASGLRYGIPFYAANGTALSALPASELSYDVDTQNFVIKGNLSFRTSANESVGGIQTTTGLTSLGSAASIRVAGATGLELSTQSNLVINGATTSISGGAVRFNSVVANMGSPIAGGLGSRASLTLIDWGATGVTGGPNPLTVRSHSNVASYTPAITLQKIKGAAFNSPAAITTGDVISAVRFSSFDGVTTTVNITNVARSAGIATITVDANHGMPVGTSGPIGWVVSIDCNDDTYDTVHETVISVPNTTSFTVATPGADELAKSATGTVASRNFDVRAAAVRAEAAGTIGTNIIPGALRLLVANSTGALVTGLFVGSDQTVYANGTVSINGASSGLRIGSTLSGGVPTGGALITASGTGVVLPAGSTIAGVAIGSIKVLGTKANNTALNAVTGMVAGDAYVLLDVTPYHLWSYTGSAWVDIGAFQGAAGTNGSNGTNGQGVVTGGTTGQVLAKIDGTNYNTQWISLSAVATTGNYSDIAGKPTDLSNFTDTTNLIPADISDLTDTTNLIPAALTDLGIVDGDAGQVLTTDGSGAFTFTTVAGASSNSFSTIAVAGQDNVVADSSTDTLTLVAGTNITLTTNATNDSITINSSGSGSDTNTTYSIKASTATGGATLDLDAGGSGSGTDSIKFASGTGITVARTDADTITVSSTVTNTDTTYSINAVDGTTGKKIIRLTAGGSGSGNDDITLVAGTNITLDRSGEEITINSSGGGGGSMASRTTALATTASIADGATGNIAITGFKSYALLKVTVEHQAWVRIYTDTASRTADASRLEGTDPTPGSGVIAEIITTAAPQTILISPGVFGFNNEITPTTSIPIAVTNKSGTTRTITVTLTLLQLEA
jgi:hypothetical protein